MGAAHSDDPLAAEKIQSLLHRIDEAANAVHEPHVSDGVTARERMEQLLDECSFTEFEEITDYPLGHAHQDRVHSYGDGVAAGYGTVDGRPVAVFAQDATVIGGALGEAACRRIVKVMDFALKTGCPVIAINDAGWAGTPDGGSALGVHAKIFHRHVHCSGVIPQISLITGSPSGCAVHSHALSDFTVMTERTSHLISARPELIKAVTGQDIELHQLGGARSHSNTSGVAHHMAGDEGDAIGYVKSLLSYLPSNNLEEPPAIPGPADLDLRAEEPALDTVVPASPNQPYDMAVVVQHVLDDQEFLETQPLFAPNIITGFGRIEGHPIGVVASQPMHSGGCLDINACEKAARFIRTCDAFNVPVLTFVDAPGFLPGADQEHNGIVRRGAKLIYAYAEATVPLITVVTRKAYNGIHDVMGSTHLGADLTLAWPTAQIGNMGPHSAVDLLHGAARHEPVPADPALEAQRAELTSGYEETFLNPCAAAERGHLDAVIRPSRTRQYVVRALRALRSKRETLPPKKHGNIPL
ncbi:acyl-CoA carboxylase subunit beta [Streptomyces xantholiticus]|uniref:acyl-CoA carboxylase subunit beta n=1 Tax=Streptomyces xantholiticus TaxID=68285 RepID=UPI0016783FBC|nr:acyl-CoA carboxylase subunit beta [Streptomyces xantholiticus]GGW49183.1 methylmalonyl-CoA carboxyltransferase [Streptomyces xantholiticus]